VHEEQCFRAQFEDIDDYIDSLRGWELDIGQLVPGRGKSGQLFFSVHGIYISITN